MKVIVALVILLSISWVSAQAPYPPSGYRPQGRPFNLPARPADNQGFGSGIQPQNQYVPPTNQYGAPDNSQTPPPSQYLPGLQSTDFRSNTGQSNIINPQGQQSDFSGQNRQNSLDQQIGFFSQQSRQQQYGAPDQNQQLDRNRQQLEQNRQQFDQNRQQLNQNRQNSLDQQIGFGSQQSPQQQYGAPDQNRQQLEQNQQQLDQNRQQLNQNRQQYYQQQSYLSQSKNIEQQGFSDQNQGFGIGNVNQQGWAQRPTPRTSASERNYLAPAANINVQQRNQQNRKQTAKQQLYEAPNPRNNDEDSDNNNDQAFSANDDQNLGANQNYLPPTTTTERRRYPEPTTRRPESREEDEPEDNEAQDPNVAIATAVAKGQYYLWQPDGRLQRVLYKTTQTEEDLRNNAYTAKLVYQAVQPITAPIYTYNAPLVRLG